MTKKFLISKFDCTNIFVFKTEQLEEIDDILEMKISHRKNIKRRREKFGIESTSILGLDVEAAAAVLAPEDGDEENPFGD